MEQDPSSFVRGWIHATPDTHVGYIGSANHGYTQRGGLSKNGGFKKNANTECF